MERSLLGFLFRCQKPPIHHSFNCNEGALRHRWWKTMLVKGHSLSWFCSFFQSSLPWGLPPLQWDFLLSTYHYLKNVPGPWTLTLFQSLEKPGCLIYPWHSFLLEASSSGHMVTNICTRSSTLRGLCCYIWSLLFLPMLPDTVYFLLFSIFWIKTELFHQCYLPEGFQSYPQSFEPCSLYPCGPMHQKSQGGSKTKSRPACINIVSVGCWEV